MAKKKEELAEEEAAKKEKSKGLSSQDLLGSLLNDHAEFHYQNQASEPYIVSTGSLKLDRKLDGGLPAGMHRFCGITEGGKSSEALEVIKNFLLKEKRKALYVDAEGKLSRQVKERSGVSLVYRKEDWVEGTCYVFQCNIYEVVGSFLRTLITNNNEELTFGFVVDSMDALIKKSDLEKELDESDKVAAAATMTSSLFKRLNLPIQAGGHLCILISQVRSKMKIDTYGPKLAPTLGMFSGGNAALHYANYIFEFLERYQDDYIYENPEAKTPDKRGKTLGKLVKIRIAKSMNETTGETVDYPVRNGKKNGTSIWKEREIVDELVLRGAIEKNTSWFKIVDYLKEEITRHGFKDVPDKFQGLSKWYEHIEKDSELRDFLYNYLSN